MKKEFIFQGNGFVLKWKVHSLIIFRIQCLENFLIIFQERMNQVSQLFYLCCQELSVFFRRYNLKIMLRNEIIPSNKNTQFLGMTFYSRLNWEKHFNKLRAKAKRALNAIRVVAGKIDRRLENPKRIIQCNIVPKNCNFYPDARNVRN